MAVVRILGIDPGTVLVGYACLEVEERSPAPRAAGAADAVPLARRASNLVQLGTRGGRVRLLEAGALRLGARQSTVPQRLQRLAEEAETLLGRWQPQELALEEAFFGKSVQAALRIGEARGVVLALAQSRGLDIHQYAPARIKRVVAGHGAASKQAVGAMALRSLGLEALAGPPDVTDAAAVALCRYEERRGLRLEPAGGSVRNRIRSKGSGAGG